MMMNLYGSILYRKFLEPLFDFFSDVQWENLKEKLTGRKFNLRPDDWDYLAELLAKDYYVILTRRNAHLTTYLIGIGDWLKRPRIGWSHYSHVVVQTKITSPKEALEFVESIKGGVRKAKFEEVFNCDSVCLLKGKWYSRDEWRDGFNDFVAEAYENLGKPYDDLLNPTDQSHDSCVEVGRDSIRQLPDYDDKFSNFESMIWKYRNLTPQMFRDSTDFEVVFEIRR